MVVSRFGFLADFAEGFGRVGVLRLRRCFASRSGYSAQDDTVAAGWWNPAPWKKREERGTRRAQTSAGVLRFAQDDKLRWC